MKGASSQRGDDALAHPHCFGDCGASHTGILRVLRCHCQCDRPVTLQVNGHEALNCEASAPRPLPNPEHVSLLPKKILKPGARAWLWHLTVVPILGQVLRLAHTLGHTRVHVPRCFEASFDAWFAWVGDKMARGGAFCRLACRCKTPSDGGFLHVSNIGLCLAVVCFQEGPPSCRSSEIQISLSIKPPEKAWISRILTSMSTSSVEP